MDVKLVNRQQELSDVWTFFFSKPAGFVFEAGDYTELQLNLEHFAGRRWFTIASAPHEELLQFTIKYPTPHSDYKAALLAMNPGQTASISPAIGNFNLPLKSDKLLFVAAGIGITPFVSMAKHALRHNLEHDINLVHLARDNHLYSYVFTGNFKTELWHPDHLKFNYGNIAKNYGDLAERMVYLAGPEDLMSHLHQEFIDHSHPRHRLKLEYFEGHHGL